MQHEKFMIKRSDIDAAELSLWADANGLSNADLAAALGVSVITVWRWRNNKGPIPPMVRQALVGLEAAAAAKNKRTAER